MESGIQSVKFNMHAISSDKTRALKTDTAKMRKYNADKLMVYLFLFFLLDL